MGVCARVCMGDAHPVIIGKSNLSAPLLPSTQQLEWGEPEFSVSTCSVMVGTCEKRDLRPTFTHSQDLHIYIFVGTVSLQNVVLILLTGLSYVSILLQVGALLVVFAELLH